MHKSHALKRSDVRAAHDQVYPHPTPNPDQSVRVASTEFGSWGGGGVPDEIRPSLTLGIPLTFCGKARDRKNGGRKRRVRERRPRAQGAFPSKSRLRLLSPVASIFHSATNLSVSLSVFVCVCECAPACVSVWEAHRRME